MVDVVDTAALSDDARAQWAGYRATLVGLAEAGAGDERTRRRRGRAADDLLERVDELMYGGMVDAQLRMRRQLGRALVALGSGRLWPALYALTDCEPREVRPGDAEAFLEQPFDDVPDPPSPCGWPAPWLAEGERP